MPEITPTSASKLDERLPFFLLPLLALGIVLPFILHGCSCGHDFDFHLVSWFEGAQQLRHGTLIPHWAFTPAWNAGEPRFVFYPPLSWLLGEILALIYWPTAYIAFIVIALSAAGLAFYRLARAFVQPHIALFVAALYMLNPYMLFTVYERSAYGELLAAPGICLLLLALLRDRPTVKDIAIPIGLLWLTNVPAGLIGCYMLGLLTLVRFLYRWISTRRFSLSTLFPAVGGFLLGLALAGWYLIPALWEGRWVQTRFANIPILLPQNNLLFGHTDDVGHDIVLRTASIVALILIFFTLITLAALLYARFRDAAKPTFVFVSLLVLALAVTFLVTPLSAPLWPLVPQLSFIQFSWRFLIVLGPVGGLAFALLLAQVPLGAIRTAMSMVLLGFILIPISIHAFRQHCDPEDTPLGLRSDLVTGKGAYPTDEYTPNGADGEALHQGNFAYWLASNPDEPSDESDNDTSPPLPMDFLVDSPQKQFLILNLRDYPAWRVRINGQLVPQAEHRHRDDGLIAVPLIAGLSTVNLSYATTGDITLGRILTLLALVRLFFLFKRRSRSADLSSPER